MRRPEGFDPRSSPVEEDTEPTFPQPRKNLRRRGPKQTADAAAEHPAAEPVVTPAPRPPRTQRPLRERTPRREPTEVEAAAALAKESARQARREARNAAAERRRVERAEVRRFTRRSRNRRIAWMSAGGVALVLGSLIAVAVYSPLLSLDEIRVTGTARLDAEEVRGALDSQLGTPLALVDFDQVTEDLSAFPLIRSYVTEAVPPHTLVIHVSERQPVASVLTEDGYVLVDPAGIEIERTEARPEGVPLIQVDESQIGDAVFDATIEVLLALPAPLLAQVDQVSASTMDDVTLVFSGVGQRVVWGSADRSELKARVLEKLLLAHDQGAAVEFDVTAPMSAVVRPI